MLILGAELTVQDLDASARYYAEMLGLPVERGEGRAMVTLGASTLTLTQGPPYAGEHHLAFGIAPEDFEATLAFARARLAPISAGGSDVIDGPGDWNSRSVYFRGPAGIVLEYIAREAHRGRDEPTSDDADGAPRVTCLSEVGLGVPGVPGVPAAVEQLGEVFGLPPFPPQEPEFAPVGDHDGLLILVDPERTWFPTQDASAPRGPLTVTLASDGGVAAADLTIGTTTIRRPARPGA